MQELVDMPKVQIHNRIDGIIDIWCVHLIRKGGFISDLCNHFPVY